MLVSQLFVFKVELLTVGRIESRSHALDWAVNRGLLASVIIYCGSFWPDSRYRPVLDAAFSTEGTTHKNYENYY